MLNINQISINKYLNYSLVFFVFSLSVSRSGISVGMGIIGLLWIIEGSWKRKWQILKKDKLFWSIVVYILWVSVTLLWTANYQKALLNMKNYGHLILIPVLITSLQKSYKLPILRSYGLGILTMLVLSIIKFVIHDYEARESVVFMNNLDYSLILAWAINYGIVLLFLSKEEKLLSRIDKILWGVIVIISFFWIFVQQGRIGQLAMICVIPFTLFSLIVHRRKIIYFSGLLMLFFVLIVFFYKVNKPFHDRVNFTNRELIYVFKEKNYHTSIGRRIFTSEIAWKIIKDNPLGVGVGDNMDVFTMYWAKEMELNNQQRYLPDLFEVKRTHMHNQYLQILTESGIPGLFLFLLVFIIFSSSVWNNTIQRRNVVILNSLFLIGFIAEPFLHAQFTSALYGFFAAFFYSQYLENKKTPEHEDG